MKKIHRHISSLFYAVLIVFFGFIVSLGIFAHKEVQAETGTPFGGFVSEVWWCSCSMNLRVTFDNLAVNAPAPGTLMFNPAVTILHPFYQIYQSGVWILGNWGDMEQCIEPECYGECCVTGTYPLMTRVGTSM
jgi:ABC-type multidrug transport system permease subunit